MQDLDFSGRRVVITGAASGIGQGLARAFAAQRAELVLLDRDREALAATVAELA
ncbi:MAG: SDR family NAD(P)-dependent oxidoreductase, partial [Marinobacter sp.]|nr:SDR family NAD(P)-dependent oxidoreductase [Marinobacter sp.]